MFLTAERQKKITNNVIMRRKYTGFKMFKLSMRMQVCALMGYSKATTKSTLTNKEKALLINLGYEVTTNPDMGTTIVQW